MKKIFVLLFGISAFGQAFAAGTDICGGTSPAHDATAAVAAGSGKFVATAFTPKCSANTFVAYEQDATVFAVGAASVKGKTIFSGSTKGGGVTATGTCTTTCATGDATGATATYITGSGGGGQQQQQTDEPTQQQ